MPPKQYPYPVMKTGSLETKKHYFQHKPHDETKKNYVAAELKNEKVYTNLRRVISPVVQMLLCRF